MYDKYKDFIDEIERIASIKYKKGVNIFLKAYFSKESADFLNDILNHNIEKYQTEDWKKIVDLGKSNLAVRKLLTTSRIPKWVFTKVASEFNDFDNVLRREDLTDGEINTFLKMLGIEKIKNILINNPQYISDTVISYMVKLPKEELKKYDYIPLRIVSDNLGKEELYLKRYGEDENALSEIINNRFISNATKLQAFNMGCNIERIINPPDNGIATDIYKILAETIFETDVKENLNAVNNATEKLIDLIKNDKLPYSCQIDFLERYKRNPFVASDEIINFLSGCSKSDEVLAKIVENSLDAQFIVKNNPYAGRETYDFLKTYTKAQKKTMFLEFFSHKQNNSALNSSHIQEAGTWGDENLNKLLASDIMEIHLERAKHRMGEYKFYYDFRTKLRTTIKSPERAKQFILTFLLHDPECDLKYIHLNQKKDNKGNSYISVDDINSFISKKYKHIGCIKEEEYNAVKETVKELRKEVLNDEKMAETKKKNLLTNLNQYEHSIDDIWKKEEIRRCFPSFFWEIYEKDANKQNTFRLNIFNIIRNSDDEIEEFNKYIANIKDLYVLKCIKKELLEGAVDSINNADSPFLFAIITKCNPIFTTIKERYNTLRVEKVENIIKRTIFEMDK